ncbi:BadF/BadG/BcrA/BcrD type ATPase [Zymomonas mobilis subsp. mobilis ZM4 = ATCC 31821]|uniref:ATPase BadF/BadG/BcrA/BcrD type n=1 Tax=Zymomonas mobilis subsp. mobilis (strain ATCC 31821 / ZM4 / CP4) TaxID=264203 RepID=Q5NNB7_ZYMMO|nr:BadF/BadG/BcrA/BcrD ATPase family protein [Zymomonas mobilis]AAV89793.1 ATPase BadF/BadG/BcrA/BcrD type [Zymomonas mobilis subsp. mobilis ZM4 = ATCC 31821]AVZ26053.1 BadF/BadG/BcrA/BcrD type ATPase [Zymomonas mobilis subsp. mobilis]AVZ27944.1 BadF/BadG/BcrA/BcrD type ATPase [Zymomonas mobilis subsp. mobilis]AVZ42391.1 BadF/BadG/BcrA/BcrD type ATPase [Zymomonas mobilis subsp. mobilis ZM4 = ATCC 31821]UBQ07163.1 ATPase [Zymomonas mobilis]
MVYFLGVDAGGSHCRSRLTDQNGRILGSAEIGAANARIGIANLWPLLMQVTELACQEAGLNKNDWSSVHAAFGIAGLSRPGLQRALEDMPSPFAAIRYTGDDEIANIGAHRGHDGAILILGTGSIAHIRIDGKSETLGGYGFPISDEASGAWLGLESIRHSLRAYDGRIQKTIFTERVIHHFSDDILGLVAWMDAATATDYALFAPWVIEAGIEGDPVAYSIIQKAVAYIENFIEVIFQKGVARCCLMGGLAAPFMPWLSNHISCKLSPSQGDALDGALILSGLKF